ncbi:TIR domain-containing protein [Streptomyces sp. LX-29]|uniref:TIR domain-containing protein n=1 Tax=Streptomyces sp. LX-29 TaxID=2900152 RepID=UPI00240E6E40|nr:TIR domain-containing protein [Streptomyces sp. LX-29]WFB06078.1 TIR domain-containing protein [Streptomyces sp. LX-29]
MFISYAEADADWAALLADRLRSDGVRVFFDRCSLRPGDVVVHQLEAAMRGSRHGIQIVGPLTMTEAWARQEYAALVQASTGHGMRLIPVLCGDADIPPFAATRVWMDFRKLSGDAFNEKAAELARVLRGEERVRTGHPERELLDLVRPPSRRSPTEPTPASFVVCYARADAGYGEGLVDHLARADLPAWSLGDLTWGDDYLWTIRQRLRHALAVVVLMSPEAEESEDVTREILEGQRHSREFFPILLRGDRNYLLASSWYFDARNGQLPGPEELRLLRRLHPRSAGVDRSPVGAPVMPPPPAARARGPARAALAPAVRGRTSLSRLEALLAEREFEHADLLTTTLLLESVGRLDTGWLRRADGRRLPDALLSEIDGLWARFSDETHGFRAQARRALLGGGRHADFMALSVAYGWRGSAADAVPTYQDFVRRSGGHGFFPTLRNPQSERYVDWYDQWTETVLAVHLRLREEGRVR